MPTPDVGCGLKLKSKWLILTSNIVWGKICKLSESIPTKG